jgi:23S rRNA pseudouridine1911/1915/1917 synthase
MSRFVVPPSSAGGRLDAFLAGAGAAPSHQAAKRAIAEGRVRVDGRPAKKGQRVLAGQTIDVAAPAPPGGEPPAEDPGAADLFELVHEDDDLVAVAKPAGVPSVSLRPGERGTVAAALVRRFPECARAAPTPEEGGLVHRLDTGTSGLLVAARSASAWASLRTLFGGGGSDKEYVAEVVGAPPDEPPADVTRPAPGRWIVDAPIGRVGRRGALVRIGGGRGALPARSEVALLERRGPTTLLSVRLQAGRTHQVRAHLAHLGCPVLGDALYGAPADVASALGVSGFRLHAARVAFCHPRTGVRLVLEAPAPPWAVRRDAP